MANLNVNEIETTRAECALQDHWTVFLVDDDFDDQILSKKILDISPDINDVACINSGEELFRKLGGYNFFKGFPDKDPNILIILDIHMPGENGVEILQHLKDNPYTANIPVLMLTEDIKTDLIEETYTMKANGYLCKPLRKDHLNIISKILRKGHDWRN